jgi:hypothetical protein
MNGLNISPSLTLPLDSVTKTFAIIAQRRKGKTYTANVMAEEMVDAGIPWVALDPTGAWWGLRSSADGRHPGLPVYVFGGDHGDLPLERTAGKMIADLVVEHPGWYILDFSHFESKEAERQLATDFAERFYRIKGKNKAPMHLFVDEADMFAPQRIPSGDQRMLGAFESIVRRGGIRGIGTTLITQRAAVLNKNVLEQIDVLIALRTIGPNDRKAIASYVEANGTAEQQAELMGSIASLNLGEAWVWEPGEDLFQRVQIRKRRTFNSSATPNSSEPIKPVTLASVDLEKIREQMAATIEKVEADDPKALRRRIAELEHELSQRNLVPISRVETHEVIKEALPAGFMDMLNEIINDADNLSATALRMRDKYRELDSAAAADFSPPKNGTYRGEDSASGPDKPVKQETSPLNYGHQPNLKPTHKLKSFKEGAAVFEPIGDNAEIKLGPGERKILIAIGQHPSGITRSHLTVLTDYKRSSRNTYISRLAQQGLVSANGEMVTITDRGVAELGNDYDPLPTGDALRDRLMNELPPGERAILQELVNAYPNGLSRDDIGTATGYMRSSRNTYISRMAAREIIEISGQNIRASDTLFKTQGVR